MDTMEAFARNMAAIGPGKVFDWDKAARILAERKPQEAFAGLSEDLEWTMGLIWFDGAPDKNNYTYLASNWATPVLIIDDEHIPCWVSLDEAEWDSGTKWPDSALAIVQAGE